MIMEVAYMDKYILKDFGNNKILKDFTCYYNGDKVLVFEYNINDCTCASIPEQYLEHALHLLRLHL